MNVMDLVAKLTLDNVEYLNGLTNSEKEAKSFASRAKSGLKTLSKVGVAAVGAATTAAGVLLKTSVSNYAEYEQMLGGVRKLYGNMGLSVEEYAKKMGKSVNEVQVEWKTLEKAQNDVLKNAEQAYLTSGMSANEYMSMATTFSASLINSLKGDTIEAAKQTDVAMRAISDNFNTFGGDIGLIQNAFQGFAKQNYAMLDNLKLGYGGTKKEMQRLIDDANAWAEANGKAADLSIDSFSDVVTAIDYIQQKQNIAGTTAREAATTIEGSLMSLKAAWSNLVTGFANPENDIGILVSNVMESAGTAAKNLVPAISRAIEGMGGAINTMMPDIVKGIPKVITDILIPLVSQGLTSVGGILKGAIQELPSLLSLIATHVWVAMTQLGNTMADKMPELIQTVLTNLVGITQNIRGFAGRFVDAGLNIVMSIANGIIQNIPTIVQTVPTIVTNIAGVINDNAPKLVSAGLQIIVGLVKGIIQAIPVIMQNLPQIINAIWNVFTAVNWLALGGQLMTAILNGIKALGKSIPSTLKNIASNAVKAFKSAGGWKTVGRTVMNVVVGGLKALVSLPSTILRKAASLAMKAFTSISWGTVGKNIVSGIARGITAGLSVIVNAAKNAAKSALNAAKNFLGIQSPSKVFRNQVGKNIALGMAKGIEDGEGAVNTALKSLNTNLLSTPITANVVGGSALSSGGSSGDVFNFNMAYDAGNDANDLLRDFARGVQRYKMAGAI